MVDPSVRRLRVRLQTQLPEGVSLSIRPVKNNWKDLVLSVKLVKGLVQFVR